MSESKVSTEDLEILISLVKEYPAVYDMNCAEYKDSIYRNSIWDCIAQAMGRDGIDATLWKKKWRNQRDMYVKKRREMKANGEVGLNLSSSKRKRWPLMDSMSFLDNYLLDSIGTEPKSEPISPERDTQDDSSHEPEEDSVIISGRSSINPSHHLPQEQENQTTLPLSLRYSPTPDKWVGNETSDNNNVVNTATRSAGYKRSSFTNDDVDAAFLDFIQTYKKQKLDPPASTSMSTCSSKKSITQSFFETCMLRMEKLPQELQSYVQLQISQIFFNAENHGKQCIPVTPLPKNMASDNELSQSMH